MSANDAVSPLSTLLGQGWELVGYSASVDPNNLMLSHCFLVRKGNRAKVLTVRKKMFGEGLEVEQTSV